jgi:hypothetical protein
MCPVRACAGARLSAAWMRERTGRLEVSSPRRHLSRLRGSFPTVGGPIRSCRSRLAVPAYRTCCSGRCPAPVLRTAWQSAAITRRLGPATSACWRRRFGVASGRRRPLTSRLAATRRISRCLTSRRRDCLVWRLLTVWLSARWASRPRGVCGPCRPSTDSAARGGRRGHCRHLRAAEVRCGSLNSPGCLVRRRPIVLPPAGISPPAFGRCH